LAGLFHDYAKNLSPEQLLEIAERENLAIDDLERNQPGLLHARVGIWIARSEFGLEDKEIIKAIEFHTTGRAGMGNLEKIIFVSDYAEPNRKYHGCDNIRKLAEKDLDLACLETVKAKIEHILTNNQQIHPDAVSAWNWLVNVKGTGG
jgi:predicted HD superfamily hydrolase involved in NAD metabolism